MPDDAIVGRPQGQGNIQNLDITVGTDVPESFGFTDKSKTLPSGVAPVIDIPTPKINEGEFVYVRHTPDESVSIPLIDRKGNYMLRRPNEDGTASLTYVVNNNIVPDGAKEAFRTAPRFVKISFSGFREIFDEAGLPGDISNYFENYANKIQSERTLTLNRFINFNMQPGDPTGKIVSLIQNAASIRNLDVTSNIDQIISNLNKNTTFTLPLTDLLPIVKNNALCGVKEDVISKAKTKINSNINCLINSKFASSLVEDSLSDPNNPFILTMETIKDEISRLQTTSLNSEELLYDLIVDPLENSDELNWDASILNNGTPNNPYDDIFKVGVVGYTIDKFELVNGTLEFVKKFFVKGIRGGTFYDLETRYGAIYGYTFNTIVKVDTVGTEFSDDGVAQEAAVSFLLSSSPSNIQMFRCINDKPPEPPEDVKPIWDYEKDMLNLTWSYPVNISNDIKRFQVYKRKNIRSPFEILAEIDFDDSIIKADTSLEFSDLLKIKVNPNEPKVTWFDPNFRKLDSEIYTVTTVDAHGFVSNYGMQIEVKFDQLKNRVFARRISQKGAPLAFPNLLIDEEVFDDAIKVSGYSEMSVYFEPDYYKVTYSNNDQTEDSIDIVPFDVSNEPNYKLKILNVNTHKSEIKTINVKDKIV